MNKRQETTFLSKPVTLLGNKLSVGDNAPEFTCLNGELHPVSLSDFKGKNKIISVVPSIDTGVCELQTIRFNKEASSLENSVVLTISCDLPFAQNRFCAAKEIKDLHVLSDHKDLSFGYAYGFAIEELRLLNRGIVIIDKENKIAHIEYVKENKTHPDYDKAIYVAKSL